MTTTVFTSEPAGNIELAAGSETIVANVGGISAAAGGGGVILSGQVHITPGARANRIVLRIRRGFDVGSPMVGGPNWTTTQGIVGPDDAYTIGVEDTSEAITDQTYILTAQQVASVGKGVASQARIQAAVR